MVFLDLERADTRENVDCRNPILVHGIEVTLLGLELAETLEPEHVCSAVGSDLDPASRALEAVRRVEEHLGVAVGTVPAPILADQATCASRPFLRSNEFRLALLLLVHETEEIANLHVDLLPPRRTDVERNVLTTVEAVAIAVAPVLSTAFQVGQLVLERHPLTFAVDWLTTKGAGQGERPFVITLIQADTLTG